MLSFAVVVRETPVPLLSSIPSCSGSRRGRNHRKWENALEGVRSRGWGFSTVVGSSLKAISREYGPNCQEENYDGEQNSLVQRERKRIHPIVRRVEIQSVSQAAMFSFGKNLLA